MNMLGPLFLLLTAPLWSWGNRGHRVVANLALQSLPVGPAAWYAGHEAEVLDHASDPDHWKQDHKEGPRHFLNLEPYGGPAQLPRSLEAAQAQVGGGYYRLGVVPWVIQDRWRDLVAAFREGDAAKVRLTTAILGHYIADIHVPLHSTTNHDGLQSGQRGIHSRWESGLVERYVVEDTLKVPLAQADPALMDRPWEWLLAAHALVPQLLADDLSADRTTPVAPTGKTRGTAYWMILWAKQGPVVQQQLQVAGQHLGDAVVSAWVSAGRPSMLISPPTATK
jgi:hypothetical protein